MWKDFFYFSLSERRAIYVLLVLIAVLIIAIIWTPTPKVQSVYDVAEADSLVLKLKQKEERKSFSKNERIQGTVPATLAPFEPNLADSIELLRLGLPSYVVNNVIKYRQKGGRFSTPESFARIYGLTEEKFKELKPYIYISKDFIKKPEQRKFLQERPKREHKMDSLPKPFKYPEGTLVDVNAADTTELKKIPGIGSGIARRIVAYRNRLGGFYSLEQLNEVEFVTADLFKWFKLESDSIRKLPINRVGLDKLRAHPYINFYQAKVIVEYRRKRGEIKSLSQLSLYEEFTEKDLKRLSAYVSFD
jgi:competence ComEA-like helix-hairpin-helix protein